jgi:hypothetical protein
LLKEFGSFVSQTLSTPIFHVLLIITDGAITDFPVTTDEIVKLSKMPVSIIIVGVGKGPFG